MLEKQLERVKRDAVAAFWARRFRREPWALSGWWSDGRTQVAVCYGDSPIGLGDALLIRPTRPIEAGRPEGYILREAHYAVTDEALAPWTQNLDRPVDRVEQRPIVEVR